MYRGYALVRELVRTNPLPLLKLKDPKLINYAESLLPYSIGLEFECSLMRDSMVNAYINETNERIFGTGTPKISELMPYLVSINNSHDEQRFRIPKGIKGLVCLWHITLFLKEYYGLNTSSGVHYHVDMSEEMLKPFWTEMKSFNSSFRRKFLFRHNKWMMGSLKNWGYKGTYNTMRLSYDLKDAVKLHADYRTMEVRIGEMTFDYKLLCKRILNCSKIAVKLKKDILAPKMAPKVEKGPKLNNANIRDRSLRYSIFDMPDFVA